MTQGRQRPKYHDVSLALAASKELRAESRRLRLELSEARLEAQRFRGVSRIYRAFVDSKRSPR